AKMKVPPPSNVNPPARTAPDPHRAAPRRTTNTQGPNSAAEDGEPSAHTGAAGRDFASVLEELTRAEPRREDEGEGERQRDSKQPERAEHEQEARRQEDRQTDSDGRHGGGFEQRHGVARDLNASAEASNARAILHVADLERVVSAVRAQALAGGGREVVIELKRSVLEGLRVRLSTDAAGRVTAEFIAASERVRAQLDGRSNELAELLRSRGVNLAALRTTLGSETNSGGGDTPRDTSADAHVLHGRAPFLSSHDTTGADEASPDDETSAGSTYRA
ncbi:MAG TPA: hypothetical protein VGV38_05505, partial [Pyrinomonadaceae bacterium]|nr:hypothetical protein [Pyrinomonadaceae bacterium]